MGMCSSRRLVHTPGLKPATGKYATRATDTDFDNKANITILQFFYADRPENAVGLNPTSVTTFSLWDGADGMHAFWSGNSNGKSMYPVGKGSTDYSLTTSNVGGAGSNNWAGNASTLLRDGVCSVWAYTHDASLSEDDTKVYYYSLQDGKTLNAIDNSEANLGALGTSTAIRLGNLSTNGSNVSQQMTAGAKIGKTAIWFSTLTTANIEDLVNYTGTGSMIFDVTGRYGAAGYSGLGITQPNHEWVPMLDGTISDTGSDGGKDLTIEGSAKIATFGAY